MNTDSNIPCVVFGASGYAGVELASLIARHPELMLDSLYVSDGSADSDKRLSQLYPKYTGQLEHTLLPAADSNINELMAKLSQYDQSFIFLATPHEFSHDIASSLISDYTRVFDLSGAFRLKDPTLYQKHYNFTHNYSLLLSEAAYGLAEWHEDALLEAKLISLPGCYPTAVQLALKPLLHANLLDPCCKPVINAISGVSGAGRKASLATSHVELSLKPYNLFSHRHTPEINQGLDTSVIFSPHVADYDRGLMANCTVRVAASVTLEDIESAFSQCYDAQPLVRLRTTPPAIKDVANTPFCDLYWQLDGQDLIVISAIDNLLKGAASQAIQCANLVAHLPQELGLLPSNSISTGVIGHD